MCPVAMMVFMSIGDVEVCARAAPLAVKNVGEEMMFTIDMLNMHLIDPEWGNIL